MDSSLLLCNGTVLQHDAQDNVVALKNTDIFIQNGRISQIGQNLTVGDDASVIDCQDKIVSPGFINAHHHVWQTQLKGRLGDSTMMEYVLEANLQSINFAPKDIFWGQLAGCLEALDAGTTCIVDNPHMSAGPDHGSAALDATIASGIRSIFCYGVSPLRTTEWTESTFDIDREPLPDWLIPQMNDFACRIPVGSENRVQLGFFFDSYSLPQSFITDTLNQVKKIGVKLITSHFRHWPISQGQAKVPEILHACNMLGSDVLLTHGNGTTPEQATLLSSAGTYIVSTPDSEVFMASGAEPVAFREDLPLTCLGADCHSGGPASMLHQMQMALASDRGIQVTNSFAKNEYPKKFQATVQKAFNLATIRAARAIQMDDQIGSITEGKLADLIIFDASTPSMLCAAELDPLTAVVRHAGVREIETVIIGGKICKQYGTLNDVQVTDAFRHVGGFQQDAEIQDHSDFVSLTMISKQLLKSRLEVQSRISRVSKELAATTLRAIMSSAKSNQ